MKPMTVAALTFALGCQTSSPPAPVVVRGEGAPASAASPPASVGAPPTGAANVPDALRGIVEAHNTRRAAHCAPPLAWSPEVAAVAQRYADQLQARGCPLEHSSGGSYGENLFGGTPNIYRATAVADAWYGEVSAYDFARPGFGMNTGHFTQVVWRGTQRLGCGIARCGESEVWVCNYDPPGNMEGDFPANVLPTGCR